MPTTRFLPTVFLTAALAGCAETPIASQKELAKAAPPVVSTVPKFTALDRDKTRTTSSGLRFEELAEGTGAAARVGDLVDIRYTGWLADGKLFETNQDAGLPLRLALGTGQVIPAMDDGLAGMREGGRRKLEVPPERGYGKTGRPLNVPANATLIVQVEVERIVPGVTIEDLKPGNGPMAKTGDFVTVDYTGRLTDGKLFDSTVGKTPFTFQIGEGKVIRGWDIGVAGMKAGGKRKLTVPSNLAYGENGQGDLIPPNATLVFEIEMLKVHER
jgi:peptidylprolyl isomerase